MTTQSFLKKISMVGREDLLSEALGWKTDGGFHLAFLSGGYGMGKTYFLRHIAKANQEKPAELIDLYHFRNHTPEGLARAIFALFEGREEEEYFKSYLAAQRRLEAARAAGDGKSSRDQLEKMLDGCVKALKEISAERGLFLLFDTAERFVYRGGRFASDWDWMKGWLGELPRGAALFAGRPEAKPLFESLSIPYREMPLAGFTLEQTQAYIQKAGELFEAERGTPFEVSGEDIAAVHRLSGGRPILLAMFLEVRFGSPKESLLEAKTEEFEERVIRALLSLGDNLGAAIRAAGRTKKGISPALLSRITGMSLREAKDALDRLKEMAFSKTFAGDDRVFLHDDMYDLLEKYVYNTEADSAEKHDAAQAIHDYYKEAIEEQDRELRKIFADLTGKAESDSALRDIDPEYSVKRVRAAEERRLRLKAEFIHYRLRSQIEAEGKRKAKDDDPVFAGLKMFYRFGHEAATSSNDALLPALGVELTDFWLTLGEDNPWKPFIEGMLLVNEIWLGVATGQAYDKAIPELQEKIQNIPRITEEQQAVLRELLENWRGTRLIFSASKDADYREAEDILSGVIERMEKRIKKAEDGSKILWFLRAVLSLAYRQRAYVRRVVGNFEQSDADYLQGLYYVRYVHYYYEEATLRNDLGFVQTLAGDFVAAYENLADGLRLRQMVAIGHRIALSYSSLAQHFLFKGSYEDARKNALYALSIASAVGFRRGVAFGKLAYAESARRLAALEQDDALRQTYLNEAKEAVEHALHLLKDLRENARIVDATLEEGCVYRDMARAEKDPAKKKFYFEKADEALRQAAESAERQNIFQRYADALCNRIWLGYYVGDPDYLEEAIGEFKSLPVLAPYWLTKEGKFADEERARKNPALWAQIGKYYVGRGMQALRAWRKSPKPGESKDSLDDTVSKNFLRQAARYIALGLRYSNEFGEDHRGMREARRTILDTLKTFGPDNLKPFSQYVLDAEESEKLVNESNKQSPLQKLMRKHALWYADDV